MRQGSGEVRLVIGLSAVLLAAAPGCRGDLLASANEFSNGAPELGAFQLELTGDAEREGLEVAQTTAALADVAQGLDEEAIAPYLEGARDGLRQLNQALRGTLAPVAALLREQAPKTLRGQRRWWGPATRGATDYSFVMERGALMRSRFSWALVAKAAAASTDAYRVIAAGTIVVGAERRRGRGVVGLDLDQARAADSTVGAGGKLLVSFAHGALGTALAFRLKDFTPDAADGALTPYSAVVQGLHLRPASEGDLPARNVVRLAYYGNAQDSAQSATRELILTRARHWRGIGGRIDALATGGDLEANQAYVIAECWSEGLGQRFLRVRRCARENPGNDPGCTVVRSDGDESACALGLRRAELPPTDPAQDAAEPLSPTELELAVPAESEFPSAPALAE
ncbi:MAG: hypothetical protein IPL40_10630 [Proteobacteria bacterium]|nr:hypothetical protein [Pseudomonadota bacterium]